MGSLESLFQGVSYRMTLDEVVALSYAFTNGFDIHSRYSGAFSLYFLCLLPPPEGCERSERSTPACRLGFWVNPSPIDQ